jgi:DnaD/phage-associated family protein
MNLLMGFYDWLALPVNVIEVLLDYCVSNNKKNSRYLEKVAVDWADNGITDVEQAEAYIKTFNVDYRAVMKALGHSRRDPNPKEIAYIKKWLKEYGMPLDLIVEACGKTVIQTGGTSFAYVDKILKIWHDKGFTSLEQVEADEQEFEADKKTKTARPRGTPKQKSRYADYGGRDVDYTELQRIASEHADRLAEE